MPDNKFHKNILIVVLAATLSACATSPSIDSVEQETVVEQTVAPEPIDTERYDTLSDIMYEVMTGEMSGKLGDIETSKDAYSRASELSNDPAIIERAMRIAIFAKDWPLALDIAHRWSEA